MSTVTKFQKKLLLKLRTSYISLNSYKHLLIIGICSGLVISAPHIYGFLNFGDDYSSLRINNKLQYVWDETYLYAAQTHYYLNGNFRGDTYLLEHRNQNSPFLGEFASIIPLVALSILTGSVGNSFLTSDFFFPIILFLIIFFIAKKMTKDDFFSIAAGLAVIITPNLSSLFPFFSKEGTIITGSINDPLLFSRTPHPQISLIYLFVVLFLTYVLMTKPTKRIAYFWSIAVGISLYSSLFVASTVVLGTLMLLPLVAKKIKVKLLIQCLVIIFIIAIPYLINYLGSLNFINDTDFLERTTYPAHILFPRQLRYLIFAAILMKLNKKDNLPKILFAFILAASIISDAHQLILGLNIDADHWINRVIAPVSTFSIILIIYNLLKNRNSRLIPFVISTLILAIGIYRQISWLSNNSDNLKPDIQIARLVDEINRKTNEGDVIGSHDFEINQNITGLTGRYSFLGPADRVLANYNERLERACDLVVLSDNRENQVIKEMSEYSVGLLIWNKLTDDEKEEIVSGMSKCQNPATYSNKYKINYLVTRNADASYSLIPLH